MLCVGLGVYDGRNRSLLCAGLCVAAGPIRTKGCYLLSYLSSNYC